MTQEQRRSLQRYMADWSASDRAEAAFGIIGSLGYAGGVEYERVMAEIDRVAPRCERLLDELIEADASTTLGVIATVLYFTEMLRKVLL
jgi:hypothetical protein